MTCPADRHAFTLAFSVLRPFAARELCFSARLKPLASKRHCWTTCSMAPKRQAEAKQGSPSKKQKESGKASPAELVKALLDETKLSATYAPCTWGLDSVHVVCSWPSYAFSRRQPSRQPWRVHVDCIPNALLPLLQVL